MAGHRALAAVGRSLLALLDRRFGEELAGERRPTVLLVGSQDLDQVGTPGSSIQHPALTLYCYRVAIDPVTRPAWSAVSTADGVPRLPVRMHLLISAWDDSVEFELEWLGLVARILESEPILTGPLLDSSGAWEPGDAVQLVADEVGLDTMSEAFQALVTKYRLSLPYFARVIRLGGPQSDTTAAVGTVGAGMTTRTPLP